MWKSKWGIQENIPNKGFCSKLKTSYLTSYSCVQEDVWNGGYSSLEQEFSLLSSIFRMIINALSFYC